jgi:hypothetical protein
MLIAPGAKGKHGAGSPVWGGLTFFPALALGPVAEHFALAAGPFCERGDRGGARGRGLNFARLFAMLL